MASSRAVTWPKPGRSAGSARQQCSISSTYACVNRTVAGGSASQSYGHGWQSVRVGLVVRHKSPGATRRCGTRIAKFASPVRALTTLYSGRAGLGAVDYGRVKTPKVGASAPTNQTQEVRVYSNDGAIRHRKCGYIRMTDQSDAKGGGLSTDYR
eukprot:5247389-Pyramimonas_sp.AAC.1